MECIAGVSTPSKMGIKAARPCALGSLSALSPTSLSLRSRPHPPRKVSLVKRHRQRAPRAVSYSDDQLLELGHSHRQNHGPPARELTEEEKQKRVESVTERIKGQTERRGQWLQDEAHLKHLDHELKFGKLMLAQGSIESALAHFNKVIEGSAEDSYHRGEGTLQKAACLEKLGREAEAHALYESLIRFRAPYPDIKRRAAQALFGAGAEGAEAGGAPRYDEYMYRMFLSGFGTYMPKEKRVETKEEKILLRFLPWAILLMAPLLLVSLLFFPQ